MVPNKQTKELAKDQHSEGKFRDVKKEPALILNFSK